MKGHDMNYRAQLLLVILVALLLGCRCVITATAAERSAPTFWKSRIANVEEEISQVKRGKVTVLARTPGKRKLYLIAYGDKQNLRGTANYNSACGGNDPASYARKDGAQKPVVFLLGPVHGQEVEGVAGLLNLIHVTETGRDFRGQEWKELAEHFARCRVLIVPCGNPDGRARCGYDSWVGEELPTHERIGMGSKPDGANHTWPQVKRVHPMRGPEVAALGAYWNDDAINFMHDEWFQPMAEETRAFFRLAHEEAPDFIVSLHSHGSNPSIEPTAYVPWTVKQTIKTFGDRLQKRYAQAGLPHRTGGPEPEEDGKKFPPPSFNLASALHHACGGVAFVHETCIGVRTPPFAQVTHDQLLDIQMLLYDELFRFAVHNPVKWTK
jgi:zinc carboxypeptidase